MPTQVTGFRKFPARETEWHSDWNNFQRARPVFANPPVETIELSAGRPGRDCSPYRQRDNRTARISRADDCTVPDPRPFASLPPSNRDINTVTRVGPSPPRRALPARLIPPTARASRLPFSSAFHVYRSLIVTASRTRSFNTSLGKDAPYRDVSLTGSTLFDGVFLGAIAIDSFPSGLNFLWRICDF